ncbi:hypothetical protein LCGC14_0206130 [marine sediment metagenome]|uniref:DUF3570 domain-containing protein n=1 Tax=marine sediment metagenome TaxID=412755 RepID=A0A0F9UM10_9ZZZZ|nr:DUF3570 domain-containing protein [Maribacter sp.]HDZ04335.1 DUF3570 domain-containing protein [Maribacter sp.]HEA81790.1 DUF3570 domain-containing protein [Maribacter sp.]
MKIFKSIGFIVTLLLVASCYSQQAQDSVKTYKKRVLETTEVDFLTSYYSQDGDNAAVSGGLGTEELTDFTGTFVVSIPLNDDEILTIDAGVSAYTSASSSNVDPFDGGQPADPFVASSGASSSDTWANISGSYSHSSDDRNTIVTGKLSVSSEYDYFSLGFGGGLTKLYNEKNTEVSVNANVYLDKWNALYPSELRPFASGANGLANGFFTNNTITGNTDYSPIFTEFTDETRNSYSLGFGFSQILSKNLQGSLALDFVQQQGLLSTPFQRVYFTDVADSFIDNFQLADAIEQLPDSRFKVATGGRLNWYVNETVVVRSFYRYYYDDWGISSHTASVEVPIKLSDKFTVYPSYRYYQQTAADYFYGYEEALSTDTFYTSDYDLSEYSANQFGMGVSYTDIFTKMHIWKLGLKSIDLKFYKYDRDTTFSSSIVTAGFKFVMD